MHHDRVDLSRGDNRTEILHDADDGIKARIGAVLIDDLAPYGFPGRPAAQADVGFVDNDLERVALRNEIAAGGNLHAHRGHIGFVAERITARKQEFLALLIVAGLARITPDGHILGSARCLDLGKGGHGVADGGHARKRRLEPGIDNAVMHESEVAVAEFVELQHGKQQERKGERTTDNFDDEQNLLPAAAVVRRTAKRQCHGNRGENPRRDERREGECGEDDDQRHPDAFQGEKLGHRRTSNLPYLILQGPQQESGHDDRSEGQHGGFGAEDAENVRTPGAADLEHGDGLRAADERRDGNQHVIHRRNEQREGRKGHQHP